MSKDLLLPLCVFLFSVTTYAQSQTPADAMFSGVTINKAYSLGQELQAIMDRYTIKDLHGVALAIYSESGQVPLLVFPCHTYSKSHNMHGKHQQWHIIPI